MLHERLKEYKKAISKGEAEKSVMANNTWREKSSYYSLV